MKNLILIAFLSLLMISCKKEEIKLPTLPFGKYVLSNDSGYAEKDTINLLSLTQVTTPTINYIDDTITSTFDGTKYNFDDMITGQSAKLEGYYIITDNTITLSYNHINTFTNTIIHHYESIYLKY